MPYKSFTQRYFNISRAQKANITTSTQMDSESLETITKITFGKLFTTTKKENIIEPD